jgi:hypothetical protein
VTAEADLRARILHAVRQMWPRRLGVLLFGRPASATTGPGHPDLFGIARGRFVALEIKKARAKATDLQIQRLRDLRDCGAYAWIVRTEEQACYAVYWTTKGWTRPMSNEPIDLSDWLLGDDAKPQPAGDFAPNSTEPMPFEPGGGRAVDPADTFEIPVPPQQEAELVEINEVEFMIDGEPSREARIADLDARSEALDSPEPIQQAADRDQEHALIQEAIDRLDRDLRTVGDRVTLVYERIDTYTAVLSGIHGMLEKLLALVNEDEPAETPVLEAPRPKRRSGRVKLAVPAEPNGTAEMAPVDKAMDDIPF